LKYSLKLLKIFSNECQIIGKERFLNSAVLIPIINQQGKEFILFEKRSASVRQPGEISFPGGHIDPKLDVNSISAALRETSVELGLTTEQINVLGRLGTLVTPMGVIVEAFIGSLNISNLEQLKIDNREVERIFLISLDYFINNDPDEYNTRLELHPYSLDEKGDKRELLPVKDLGLPKRYANSFNGKHRVLVYRTNKEIIWGITAELIFELSKKLRD
jgi:coenzyme A diphosphatase NUDT7